MMMMMMTTVSVISCWVRVANVESSRIWTFVVGAELAVQSQQRRWDDATRHPQLQPALSRQVGLERWHYRLSVCISTIGRTATVSHRRIGGAASMTHRRRRNRPHASDGRWHQIRFVPMSQTARATLSPTVYSAACTGSVHVL